VHVGETMLAAVRETLGTPVELKWQGEISDAEWAIATHNPARTHDVTLVILDPSRRLALIRKPHFAAGVWRPPGGGVKPGEGFLAGAAREALEETGLHVELHRYLVARRTCVRQ
jgi:8-oxo-dGTP pyrophosphatase MutT (NUDIX family)